MFDMQQIGIQKYSEHEAQALAVLRNEMKYTGKIYVPKHCLYLENVFDFSKWHNSFIQVQEMLE